MIPYCAEQEKALLSNASNKRQDKAMGRHTLHTKRSLRKSRAAKLRLFLDRANAFADANMPSLWDVK